MKVVCLLLVLLVSMATAQTSKLAVGTVLYEAKSEVDLTASPDILKNITKGSVDNLNWLFTAPAFDVRIFPTSGKYFTLTYTGMFNTSSAAIAMQGKVDALGKGTSAHVNVVRLGLATTFLDATNVEATISFSDECTYADVPLATPAPTSPGSCQTFAELAFYTTSSMTNADKQVICSAFSIQSAQCDDRVTLTQIDYPEDPLQTDTDRPQDGRRPYFETMAKITDLTPAAALAGAVSGAQTTLSALELKGIGMRPSNATGHPVILWASDRKSIASTTNGQPAEECEDDMWYLVFLILILPAMFICTKHAYQKGKKKGAHMVKEEHMEEVKYRQRYEQRHGGGRGHPPRGGGGPNNFQGVGAYDQQQQDYGYQQQLPPAGNHPPPKNSSRSATPQSQQQQQQQQQQHQQQPPAPPQQQQQFDASYYNNNYNYYGGGGGQGEGYDDRQQQQQQGDEYNMNS